MDEELWDIIKEKCGNETNMASFLSQCMARIGIPLPEPINEDWDMRGCGNYVYGLEHCLVLARVCEHPGLSTSSYIDHNDIYGWSWNDGVSNHFVENWGELPSDHKGEGQYHRAWIKGQCYNGVFPDTKLPAFYVKSTSIVQYLEHYGLVRREHHKSKKLVFPTESGKRAAEYWLNWYRVIDNIVYNSDHSDSNFWDNRKSNYKMPAGVLMVNNYE